MNISTNTPLAPPRIERAEGLLIFGITQRYANGQQAAIPSQWGRFAPHLGHLEKQVGATAYGVCFNIDEAGGFDYLCRVEVRSTPERPADFSVLRIPAQTYAVFEHRGHVSSIQATWGAIWERGLAAAGCQAVKGPLLEKYGENFDGSTGLGGFEIWIPIAA